MKRTWKILTVIAALAVAVVVAGVAVLKSMDFNRYRGLIAEQVKAATGRDLTIAGDLRLDISLHPAVAVEGVTLANAPWGSRPAMVTLGRLEAEVELLPLLSGDVRVTRLVLVGLDALLETDAKGRGNWQLATAKKGGEKAAEEGAGAATLPLVEDVRIEDVTLAYLDGRTGRRTVVGLDSLDVRAKSLDSPLSMALKGAYDGAAFEATGRFGSLNQAIEGEQPFPVSVQAKALGALLTVEGTIARPREAAGLDLTLSIRGEELAQTVEALRARVPALKDVRLVALGPYSLSARLEGSPEKLSVSALELAAGRAEQVLVKATGEVRDALAGRGLKLALSVEGKDVSPLLAGAGAAPPALPPFRIAGLLSDGAGKYVLDGIEGRLGDSDLAGRVAVFPGGKRPRLEARLTANLIDVDQVLPTAAKEEKAPAAKKEAREAKESKAAAGGERRVFSAEPLPFEALKAADATVALHAKRVKVRGVVLASVGVEIRLAGGRLTAKPVSASVADGRVSATITVDAGGATPTVAVAVDAREVDLGRLLKDLGVTDVLEARLDANVTAKGAGASVRAIMAGLEGDILATTGKGRINNRAVDLAGADLVTETFRNVNPLAKKDDFTELRCAVLRMPIRNGMATADKGIGVETAKMDIVGSGTVNLKTEALALAVRPRPKKGLGISLGGLAGLVRVKGTLADPRVGIDEMGAAKAGISAGAALATGGLSMMAQGLLDKGGEGAPPCQVALGKVAPAPAAASAPAAPAARPEKKKGILENVTEGVGGVVKGIGGALKGLFGGSKE